METTPRFHADENRPTKCKFTIIIKILENTHAQRKTQSKADSFIPYNQPNTPAQLKFKISMFSYHNLQSRKILRCHLFPDLTVNSLGGFDALRHISPMNLSKDNGIRRISWKNNWRTVKR